MTTAAESLKRDETSEDFVVAGAPAGEAVRARLAVSPRVAFAGAAGADPGALSVAAASSETTPPETTPSETTESRTADSQAAGSRASDLQTADFAPVSAAEPSDAESPSDGGEASADPLAADPVVASPLVADDGGDAAPEPAVSAPAAAAPDISKPAAAGPEAVKPEAAKPAASEAEEPEAEDAEPAPPRAAGPLFLVPTQAAAAGEADGDDAPAPVETVGPGAARMRAAANPLLAAAGPAAVQMRRLSEAEEPADPEALGFELTRLLADFEAAAAAAGLPPGTVQVGRFALAATLDDLLRARPWAARCGWLRQGLAASGPERFFDLMRAMLKNPARHRHALELFYVCLALGFEGRFRDRSQGGHELARIRDQLYRVLRRLGETPERALSPAPPKSSVGGPADPAARYRPPPRAVSPVFIAFWLLFTAAAGWFAVAWALENRTAALNARFAGMISEQSVATARPAPLPPPAGPELAARITDALAPDIRAAAVEVLAGADGALVVRLSGGAVFPAGSDAVRAFYRAVIDRVGQALAREAGRVVVVAHTDAWALATERFPNARALTEARAEAVRALLEKRLGGLRLSAEGRGDGEPIDSNDTPGGRAANRRVDVRLYP